MSATTSAYDQVAFPSYPFPASHPDRLAIAGHLAGMDVADVESCRVLELGCGAGGNILPLADTLPGSQFVGVDLSSRQIDEGRQIARAIGLANLKLLDRDILTLDDSLSKFDYIICHGVFSWTTEEVRQKILSLCSANLAPHGIALVNYNTYPGWHLNQWVRDMIRPRALTFHSPADRVREARAAIDLLIESFKPQQQAHHGLLLRELESVQRYSDEFLFHAILNFQNQPFYLRDFVESCATHALQYLGDAEPTLGWSGTVPQATALRMERLCRDSVELEQHLDFVHNTASRRSLLYHASVARNADRFERLADVWVSGMLKLSPNLRDEQLICFQTSTGRKITTSNPGLQAALLAIADAWPQGISLESLIGQVEASHSTWRADLYDCYLAGIVEFHLRASPSVRAVEEFPRATRLARWQATHQDWITNLHHQVVPLTPTQCQLLRLLDGTRDQRSLGTSEGIANLELPQLLQQLASYALLIGEAIGRDEDPTTKVQ